MLDIKRIRQNPEEVAKASTLAAARKQIWTPCWRLDKERRELLASGRGDEGQAQRCVQNRSPALKKEGKDTAPVFAEMKALGDADQSP